MTPNFQQFYISGNIGSEDLSASSFDYDWFGNNFYFADRKKGISVCSEKGQCTTLFGGRASTASRPAVVLDPPNRRMYWTEGSGKSSTVWRGDMDGTNGTLIIMSNSNVLDIAVDPVSQLLFWAKSARRGQAKGFCEIYRSDPNGKSAELTARFNQEPVRIRVAGNRLFWTALGDKWVTSCDSRTASNLLKHELRQLHKGRADFLIINEALKSQKGEHPCLAGALCSHTCVPTATGYLRCLCPDGYTLLSDGWTCECADSEFNCSSPHHQRGTTRRPKNYGISSGKISHASCPGNYFPCPSKCLDADNICNGIPECSDYSDEGDRCNEACAKHHGCEHRCRRTPRGPTCFCKSNQTLAVDMKTCTYVTVRVTEVTSRRWKIGMIVAGVVGLVLAILIVLGTVKYRRTRRKLGNLTEKEIEEFLRGGREGGSTTTDGLERALSLPYTHVISPNDIIVAAEKVLGSGEFGIVHPGIYNMAPVAVKVFKRTVQIDEFRAVLAELKIMAYLGDHESIVKFVGAEISEIARRKLLIVTELSPHGDLLRYLRTFRGNVPEAVHPMNGTDIGAHGRGVANLTLCKWCEQIASGMQYLTRRQIVHGDLAARNVLVFKDNVVKISDFGLSKQLWGERVYKGKRRLKVPWRGASIELLTSSEFSEGSDVWAFGVTAWEIFTLGQTPYQGMTFSPRFTQYIREGNRLAKPERLSEEIYKALLECWNSERTQRPNFLRLKQIFHDFAASEARENQMLTLRAGDGESSAEAEYICMT